LEGRKEGRKVIKKDRKKLEAIKSQKYQKKLKKERRCK
jgi:hypothetical protein